MRSGPPSGPPHGSAEPGAPPSRFHCDGPVPLDGLYIPRDADDDLFEALLRGELCYLRSPPQSGKSSLRLRLQQRLQARGVRSATIDLQRMSQRVSLEGFGYALIGQLAESLRLPDPTGFLVKHEALAPPARFARFLREELLPHTSGPLVVFIDEIDALHLLRSGAEDFADAIQAAVSDRDKDAALRRLTFCLIGALPPADLLNPRLSPNSLPPRGTGDSGGAPKPAPLSESAALKAATVFSGARVIELSDFSAAEAAALQPALAQSAEGDAALMLRRVLHWTDGHPRMTLVLCEALLHEHRSFGSSEEDRVDQAALRVLIAKSAGDPSLSAASRRFTTSPDSQRLALLSLYRRLLFKERVPSRLRGTQPADEQAHHQAQEALRLMGMIKEYVDDAGVRWLRVRNRVYEQAFGPAWIDEKGQGRMLTDILTRWLRSGKRSDFLLRGKELDEVLGWSSLGQPKTPDEEDYLRSALALRQEEELRVTKEALEAENRMRLHARQQQHRERLALLTLLVATALTGVLATLTLIGRLHGAEQEAVSAHRDAWERYTEADNAQGQRQRAVQLSGYALRRLLQAAQPALRGGDEAATAEARRTVDAVISGGEPAQAQAQIQMDGLYAVVLAQQPEGRSDALLTSIRGVGALRGQQELRLPLPAAQGLIAAVSESLAALLPAPPAPPGAALAGITPVLRGHNGYVRAAIFSPDSKLVATLSDDHGARLWDAQSGKLVAVLAGHSGILNGAEFSPDGKLLVTASNDHSARLWTVEGGSPALVLGGHSADVRAARFAPDGKLVATAGGDGTVRIYDVAGRLQQTLRGHERDVVSVAFSPDGGRLLTASLDSTARLWDAATGRPLATLQGHEGPVLAATFSPDGRRIATASADHTARLWDAQSGVALHLLNAHQEAVGAVSFSSDGRLVLTASTDRTARLWDGESGKLQATLSGHGGAVLTAVFSPDGQRVLTASTDHTARLWTRAGQPLGVLKGHAQSVSAAAFSPDGQRLVTASADRSARIFPATLSGFLETACHLVRPLPEFAQVRAYCEP